MVKLKFCLLFIGLLGVIQCLPVDKKAPKEEESSENEVNQRENDLVSQNIAINFIAQGNPGCVIFCFTYLF